MEEQMGSDQESHKLWVSVCAASWFAVVFLQPGSGKLISAIKALRLSSPLFSSGSEVNKGSLYSS